MILDLNDVNGEHFLFKEREIGGDKCVLITPKNAGFGILFDQNNRIFRSSIWTRNGELVSAGLPKFTNWLENPENFPVPNNLIKTTAVTKIDGSQLIISRWRGETIIRTRGMFDTSNLENAREIGFFKEKYPQLFDFGEVNTDDYSYIYEWVSNTHKIVLDYPEPELYFIGIIRHKDYSLISQEKLDNLAKVMKIKRPDTHTFSNFQDMIQIVKSWEDKEGICLYSHNDQQIHKIKSSSYLIKHQFKSNATLENTVELFFEYGCPKFEFFQDKLKQTFDEDCANLVLGFCSNICDAYKGVTKIEQGFRTFLFKHSDLSRKDLAKVVLDSYGNTNRASFVFELKDHNNLSDKSRKKLLWQVLKRGSK